jgi:ribulose-5-phosphate 4-epimerase/fuculose-1-phosphate aldolase
VGETVDSAAFWFISMDRCCQTQLLAEAAGTPVPITPENARITHGQVGRERVGWLNFQPLYAMITRDEPDLLE